MKKQLVLFLTLALCLGLTACGDTESDDTQSGYETVMDMEFLDGISPEASLMDIDTVDPYRSLYSVSYTHLDVYKRQHLSDPGISTRRVMLKVEKKDFPEYIYEDASIRDTYNEAAMALEKQQLVQLAWVSGRPVLSAIVLRLDQIIQCYAAAGRVHPKARASQVVQLINCLLYTSSSSSRTSKGWFLKA